MLDVRAEGGLAVLRTADGVLHARVAVVTAGGWARSLLAPSGVDLPTITTRETVAYAALGGGPPPTLVEWADDGAFYALPSPGEGLKAGRHRATHAVDPHQAVPVAGNTCGEDFGIVFARGPQRAIDTLRDELDQLFGVRRDLTGLYRPNLVWHIREGRGTHPSPDVIDDGADG